MTQKNRVRLVVGLLAAVLIIPTAAYAAVLIFGNGTLDSAVTPTSNLTTSDSQLTSQLYPGATVGAKTIAHNPNNFPVAVTKVYIKKVGLAVSGAGCDGTKIHPAGAFANYGGAIGEAWLTNLAEPILVPASGGAKWIEITEAVSQDASATAMCAVHADFVIGGQVGS